ncbi:MAG: alpha-glucosidase C-terminal domain-containing protein, partial [Flavobacteriaceae bacterium]|nr:alpha-glucosidase C-terminal domain-containing protein [Flavobacteriaceae bacterium]
SYERLSTENEDVVAFKRSKEEAEVYFIGNLSNQDQTFSISLEGSYKDLLQHENIVFKDDKLKLAPWNYYLVAKNNNE